VEERSERVQQGDKVMRAQAGRKTLMARYSGLPPGYCLPGEEREMERVG
jgi:hypothetical protein